MAYIHGPTMTGIPYRETQFVNRSLEELLGKARELLSTILSSILSSIDVDLEDIQERIFPEPSPI